MKGLMTGLEGKAKVDKLIKLMDKGLVKTKSKDAGKGTAPRQQHPHGDRYTVRHFAAHGSEPMPGDPFATPERCNQS